MGILLAAAIATVTSLLTIGGFIGWRSSRAEQRLLTILVLLQLPASPLVFYGIRLPLDRWLGELGVDADTRRLLTLLCRPVIEEMAKLWPFVLPFIWRSTTTETRVWRALAIGLGFGIGELWMLAEIVFRNDPGTASQTLWNLVGFINERVMVCLIHGVLTALALQQSGAVMIAIALHTAGNLPFYLQELAAFGLAAETWSRIVRTWVLAYFFIMVSLLWGLAGGDFHLIWLLFGDTTCSYCGMVYPRASLDWNLRIIHHDRCPRCHARNPE